MAKESLTPFQALAITVIFLGAGSYLVTTGTEPPLQDSWLGSVLGGLFAAPLFFIYFRLLRAYPEKDIFHILEDTMGRFLAKALIIFYLLFAFLFAATTIGNFIQFVDTVSLSLTPKYLMAALTTITCITLVQKGIAVLGRFSEFIFGIVVIFSIAAVALSLPQANLSLVKPWFSGDWQRLWQQAYAFFSNPFAGAFLLLGVLDSLKPREKIKFSVGWGLVISWFLLVITEFRNYSVLGSTVIATLFYPSYSAAGLISLGEFFQRIEVLSTFGILFSQLIRAAVAIFFVCRSLAFLCKTADYHRIAVPVSFMVFNLSLILFSGSLEAFHWFTHFRYTLVIVPLVILPSIIWLIGEIHHIRSAKGRSG